jgi:hypothetical protein
VAFQSFQWIYFAVPVLLAFMDVIKRTKDPSVRLREMASGIIQTLPAYPLAISRAVQQFR